MRHEISPGLARAVDACAADFLECCQSLDARHPGLAGTDLPRWTAALERALALASVRAEMNLLLLVMLEIEAFVERHREALDSGVLDEWSLVPPRVRRLAAWVLVEWWPPDPEDIDRWESWTGRRAREWPPPPPSP